MTRARRRGAVSLRLGLVLTVAAILVFIIIAETTLSFAMNAWQWNANQARLTAIERIIGTDPTRWRNPTWQRQADSALAALNVQAQIVHVSPGSSGRPIYTSAGARALLAVDPSDASQRKRLWGDPSKTALPTFQKLTITEATAGHSASTPIGVALLWFTGPAPGSPSDISWLVAAVAAVLLVLAVAIWFLSRAVLRPLAAMGRAAEAIAGGDLNVHLPPSRAREVAEVGAALEGMSAALRASLDQQAALDEERRRLDEERKLFIGAIAHDLRTPLFMLRGYLKGLESGVAATPEKRAHYLDACRAKADALERLIADLFAFTRLEYLEQEPAREPLELGALLREAVEGVQPLAATKGMTLVLDESPDDGRLVGDGQLLARVVANLLDNALRYTPEGGRISVRWRRDGATLVFTVADTGPGIAPHDLPHLFTPLYRAESSRNRQTGGTGLGLTIARRILRAHGGDLTAANGAAGGAVFTATLPAGRQAIAPAGPTEHEQPAAAAGRHAYGSPVAAADRVDVTPLAGTGGF